MSIRKQNASYLLLSGSQSLKIMRGNKAVVLDFFTEWFTFPPPPSWFHFNLWWARFAFLRVKVKNNPEKPFIFVTPAEVRQKTSLEANPLSHPSSLISPAWWNPAPPPRGSLRRRGAHHLEQESAVCGAVAGHSSNLFLSVAAQFGMAPPWQDVNFTDKGVQGFNRSCQDATRKVSSPSLLMSPLHKQTHHLQPSPREEAY